MKISTSNGNKIKSTSKAQGMRLSEKSEAHIFRTYTSGLYSNPIGTVVREITSNCFDSNIEANVNTPILIKKYTDPLDNVTYISFIDYGIGMSPERVKNTYSVYFESTKNQTNEQIGGYGIGGKTPLAYKRFNGEGENEYDNSFFVETISNGTKYLYTIYRGENKPEILLMHSEPTTKHNGTEVRIPILEKDSDDFEREMIRQLFYFDNIVFEGFSSYVENDYQIIRGEHFLYRNNNLHRTMHVCLGKVAYPIDYNVLGLNDSDYYVPVGLNIAIGDVDTITSRENLDYSRKTIAYLKKKLELAKEELKNLLGEQHKNVRNLEDYFKIFNNYGELSLSDTKMIDLSSFIEKSEIEYPNFHYNNIRKIPRSSELFEMFFDLKIYGAREPKINRYRRARKTDPYYKFERSYGGLKEAKEHNVTYYIDDAEQSLKRLKQAYLASERGRFYIIKKKDISYLNSELNFLFPKDTITPENRLKIVRNLQKEYMDIVHKYCTNYNDVEVPSDFKIHNKKNKLTKEILNSTIPVKIVGSYSRSRIKIGDLLKFKGIIFYGTSDDEIQLNYSFRIFETLYGDKHLARRYKDWTDQNPFDEKKSIMFIVLAKNRMKYVEYMRNPMPVEKFFMKMVWRKKDEIISKLNCRNVRSEYREIPVIFRNKNFGQISKRIGNNVLKIKNYLETKDNVNLNNNITNYSEYLVRNFNIDMNSSTQEEKKILTLIKNVKKIADKNREVLDYISEPYGEDYEIKPVLKDILKKTLSL